MRTHTAPSTLMTEGPITRQMLAFALPLMLGNLFQQFYNAADSLIVGNFLGSNALAAVSSSSNLIQLMIGLFNGIAARCGRRRLPRIWRARSARHPKEHPHDARLRHRRRACCSPSWGSPPRPCCFA